QQKVPAIIDLHANFRIADDIEVVTCEVHRYDSGYERFDLCDRFVFEPRFDTYSTSRHTCATSDDQNLVRIFWNQCSQMAEHPLEPHICWIARRLNLTGVVIVADTIRQVGHRDGRRHTFSHVYGLIRSTADRGETTVLNQPCRQRMNRCDGQFRITSHEED